MGNSLTQTLANAPRPFTCGYLGRFGAFAWWSTRFAILRLGELRIRRHSLDPHESVLAAFVVRLIP
jgi:hypothetical protein